jgi:hypothetical protein
MPSRGGQGKQCGALGATGGEDVEDGEIAAGVVGAIEGEDGGGLALRFGGFTSHPLTMKLERMGHPGIGGSNPTSQESRCGAPEV